jgi:predicted sugar kinase
MARGGTSDVTTEPFAEGGLVLDGQTSFVLAAEGDHWWSVSLSGIPGSGEFMEPLRLVADTLRR